MSKMTSAGVGLGVLLLGAVLMAQGAAPARGGASSAGSTSNMVLWPPQGMVPIIDRPAPMNETGVIVEISCFRKMGAGTASTPEQIACAKKAVEDKAAVVGILTEGDGMFKLVGPLTANNYAKFVPLIGQRVDVTGGEVILSNNFDYRAYDAKGVTAAKK